MIVLLEGSASRDAAERALLVEAGSFHAEDVRAATATEAVLGDLKDAFAVGLAALVFVDEETASDVDGVEDRLLAGEVSVLGDLADEGDDAVGRLGPVGEHLGAADWGVAVSVAVAVLTVVQGLERVLEDEHLLAGVGLAQVVGVGEEVLGHDVLACDEAVLEAESFGDHLDLEEGLFARVVEADVACAGDGVCELEEHRGLARAGGAGEHHDRRGDEAFTADGVVEPVDASSLTVAQRVGDLDVGNVRAALETLETDVEVHLAHVCTVSLYLCLGFRSLLLYPTAFVGDFARFAGAFFSATEGRGIPACQPGIDVPAGGLLVGGRHAGLALG